MPSNKKNLFFYNFCWTKWCMLVILCALFVFIFEVKCSDKIDAKDYTAVNDRKSKELIDINNKKAFKDAVFRQVVNSVAEVVQHYERRTGSDHYKESLERISAESSKFAFDTLEFISFIDSALDKNELAKLDYVRIKFKIDELKKKAENLYFLTNPNSELKQDACRILEKNNDLKVVVLTYGASHGVKTGLKWYVAVGNGKIVSLKTVMVRPFVCAAIVENNNFDDVLPGMAAYTKKIKKKLK